MRFPHICVGAAMMAIALGVHAQVDAGSKKSDSKVKASAVASKIGADGKQTVTITLSIDKGWHLYANPVKLDFLEEAKTVVMVTAKEKLADVSINYPPGKSHIVGKDTYQAYEGKVTIPVVLRRVPGNTDPLEITITVNACDKNTCLDKGTIKLTAK